MGNLVKITDEYRAELLRRMKARGNMRSADLSRISGVKKQNLSRIMNATKHSVTGAQPRTDQENVEKIADALNWPRPEAFRLLGIQTPEKLNLTDAERRKIENLLFKRRKLTPKRKRNFDSFIEMLDRQIDLWEAEDNNGDDNGG